MLFLYMTPSLYHWFQQTLHVLHPQSLLHRALQVKDNILFIQGVSKKTTIDLSQFKKILLIGYGKASVPMACEVDVILKGRITKGLVVTKENTKKVPAYIEVLYAQHPTPDHSSIEAGRRMLSFAKEADEQTLVVNVVSGGGSSLLESITFPLQDLLSLTEDLLKSGADIRAVNTVRRHLSLIKGGGLAQALWPARSISLIISDVLGDRVEDIASGPTAYDPHPVRESIDVLTQYVPHLQEKIRVHLKKKKIPDAVFDQTEHIILANTYTVAQQLHASAQEAKIPTFTMSSRISGESRFIGAWYAMMAEGILLDHFPAPAPLCVIGSGESTVTVKGTGKGGRNQELALAFIAYILATSLDFSRVYFLSAGTDGRDGYTDAAGVYLTPKIFRRACRMPVDKYLSNNDSYNFFLKTGGLLFTGATGTNVCDVQILLVL